MIYMDRAQAAPWDYAWVAWVDQDDKLAIQALNEPKYFRQGYSPFGRTEGHFFSYAVRGGFRDGPLTKIKARVPQYAWKESKKVPKPTHILAPYIVWGELEGYPYFFAEDFSASTNGLESLPGWDSGKHTAFCSENALETIGSKKIKKICVGHSQEGNLVSWQDFVNPSEWTYLDCRSKGRGRDVLVNTTYELAVRPHVQDGSKLGKSYAWVLEKPPFRNRDENDLPLLPTVYFFDDLDSKTIDNDRFFRKEFSSTNTNDTDLKIEMSYQKTKGSLRTLNTFSEMTVTENGSWIINQSLQCLVGASKNR